MTIKTVRTVNSAKSRLLTITVAYAGGTIACIATGTILSDWLNRMGYQTDPIFISETIWLITIGGSSLWVGGEEVAHALGKRPEPVWAKYVRNPIPVYQQNTGGFAGLFKSLFQPATHALGYTIQSALTGSKDVTDEPIAHIQMEYIYQGVALNGQQFTFIEEEILKYLRFAWNRRHLQYPWSRRKYNQTFSLSKRKWEAMMEIFESTPNVVFDRQAGTNRPGSIKHPPLINLEKIRKYRGVPLTK